MRKIVLAPDRASYTATQQVLSRSVRHDGPHSGLVSTPGTPAACSVTWVCTELDFEYLAAFFRQTNNGSTPFLVDLVLDYATPTTYKAWFVTGSFGVASIEGLVRTAKADLTVVAYP